MYTIQKTLEVLTAELGETKAALVFTKLKQYEVAGNFFYDRVEVYAKIAEYSTPEQIEARALSNANREEEIQKWKQDVLMHSKLGKNKPV